MLPVEDEDTKGVDLSDLTFVIEKNIFFWSKTGINDRGHEN